MKNGYHQRAFVLPADAKEVILVRHGASAPAHPDAPFPLVEGHGDPALAPEGEAQARAVAARLVDEPLTALFTTGLQRTNQTAAPLAAKLGVEPTVVPTLREIRLGEWEGGLYRVRLAERDPLALRSLEEERWDVIPGAESNAELGARVRLGLATVLDGIEPGRTGAAFVHGGIVGEICHQATGSRPFAFLHAENASLTRIVSFATGKLLLRSFNETAHLD
jgi:probable phosphoglycerate mutase